MAGSAPVEYPAVYPSLRYERLAEAITWLVEVFGLRERVRLADGEGSVHVAQMEGPEGGLVMLGALDQDFKDWLRQRLPEFRDQTDRAWPHLMHSVTLMVQDVDAHHERARAAGAVILMPPQDQPWGMRSYAVLDPEGHQWQFGRLLRVVAPEEWGATRIS